MLAFFRYVFHISGRFLHQWTSDDASSGDCRDREPGPWQGGPQSLIGVALVATLLHSTLLPPAPDSSPSSCCSNLVARASDDVVIAFIAAATSSAHTDIGDYKNSASLGDEDRPDQGVKTNTAPTGVSAKPQPSELPGKDRSVAPGYNGDQSCCSGCAFALYPNGNRGEEELYHCGREREKGHASYCPTGSIEGVGRRDESVPAGGRGKRAAQQSAPCSTTHGGGFSLRRGRIDEGVKNSRDTSASCEWCARGRLGYGEGSTVRDAEGTEKEQRGAERMFVGMWSQVQSAAWHVNACLDVLGLSGAENGTRESVAALDPLRLRPALALQIFLARRQRRLLDANKDHSSDNNAPRRGHRLASSTSPSDSKSDSSNSPHCVVAHGHNMAEQTAPTASGRGCPTRVEGKIGAGRGGGGRGGRGGDSRYRQRTCWCWLARGCRGDCPWARRVRDVLEAAGFDRVG